MKDHTKPVFRMVEAPLRHRRTRTKVVNPEHFSQRATRSRVLADELMLLLHTNSGRKQLLDLAARLKKLGGVDLAPLKADVEKYENLLTTAKHTLDYYTRLNSYINQQKQ